MQTNIRNNSDMPLNIGLSRLFGSLILVLLTMWVTCGCRHGSNITGHWAVDLSKMHIPSGPTGDIIKKSAGASTIDFNKDGTYTISAMGYPIKGTYKVIGDRIEMTDTGSSTPTKPDGIIVNSNSITFNTGPKLVAFKRVGK